MSELTLNITTQMAELSKLYVFCDEQGVSGDLMLALEEAVVNVITHSTATHVMINYVPGVEMSSIVIVDDGAGFDPTIYKPKSNNAELLEVGGQGIRIIQSLTDSIDYKRENNKNILTLSKSNK